MFFKRFRSVAAVLALVCARALAGDAADKSVLGAYDAYRAGDAIGLAKHAKKVEGHLLTPWIDYWRLSLRLEDATASEVHAFYSAHTNTYVGERLLRPEWLKVLGRRADWAQFDRELTAFSGDDLEIRCYALSSRLAHGDDAALNDAAAIWLEPQELPEGCTKLADMLFARGRLAITDIWRRVRVLFEYGHITAAKTALGYLRKPDAPDERALAEAARQPKRLIDRLPKSLESRAEVELAVLAGIRYARNDPEAAAAALDGPLGERLAERQVKYLWGRIGYEAARIHHEDALKWFARAGDTRLDDDQLAWKTRAALRRGNWQVVLDSIDAMSANLRQEATWTYWYGRALAAQGEETGARAYWLRIAGQTDFYGLLANEELGYVATIPDTMHTPTEDEVAQAKRNPGLARALELIRLGLRTEGVREWQFTVRNLNDVQLIAAAELARRAEIYDRAIHTADRTQRTHNFSLRYPVPFREVFREYAKNHALDEAWVFGLVRQESRFITEARSSAGASGLMQIMPRTARYVASKMGWRNFRRQDMHELETNVTLGTAYMKIVLEQLGHPVLASAAYNAGPARARRWRDARPLEGAIYAETIPFPETRDYVKKVMANSVFYGALLDKKIVPLKTRLGTVPARTGAEPPIDEELN
jgi:soluble lytic murein transglycosylase